MTSVAANGFASSSSAATTSGRSYTDAIECLNSLQSNAATVAAVRAQGRSLDSYQIPDFIDYVKRIGYEPEDLNRLNVLHVTGTKGKGSTSAFCNSMLAKVAPKAKIGLYTSPHMVAVRERLRINGKPLPEDTFAKYFFEVWDSFERSPEPRNRERCGEKPAYFRYLTAMAFHVFMQEKVDATILEVGIGGRYDSTNIVPQPITTGISALGIDHIFVLGKTLEEIAAQKGGIYKAGVPALTVEQAASAQEVLRNCANKAQASDFLVVPEHPQVADIKLGLAGVHQRSNASLAVAIVQSFLASQRLPAAFADHAIPHQPLDQLLKLDISPLLRAGLEETRWPGRCQTIVDQHPDRKGVAWHLDGAHTVESLQCCAEWFIDVTEATSQRSRILIFNCTSGRNAESLLGSLINVFKAKKQGSKLFDHVIFCANTTYSSGQSKGELMSKVSDTPETLALTVQNELAGAWKTLDSSAEVHVLPSIQDAVQLCAVKASETSTEGVDVLVTGSLHLVGGIFEVAELQYAL